MKIKRRKRMHMGVEASSLADILFFLMLFFLMVSTLASNNALGLLLPESRTGKVVPKEVINISIDDKLQYYVDSRKVTFEEYESSLAARSTNTKDITVVLKVDKTISVQELIKAVDVINALKLHCVIATAKQ